MNDELDILRKASLGLLYPSESDRPFEPIRLASVDQVLRVRPVVEQSVDDFFAELLTTEDADLYRVLKETLERVLTQVQVLRIGSREVDVYIIGRTKAGEIAGLHTISIET